MNTNNNIFLYSYLEIEPIDNEAYNIRKNMNFSKLMEHPNVHVNDMEVPQICIYKNDITAKNENIKDIDIYYIEYEENEHNIKVLFLKIDDYNYFTKEFVKNNTTIESLLRRTIELENNLTDDDELDDLCFEIDLDNLKNKIIEPRFYCLDEIPSLNDKLITKLYSYQLDNVHWMINLEKNPIQNYIYDKGKFLTLPDGRMYDYDESKFIDETYLKTLRGGILSDDIGIGKTLQAICLIIQDLTIKTVVIVPNQLIEFWKSEFSKHTNINLDETDNVDIFKFEDIPNIDFNNYERVIVDEIHELYSDEKIREESFEKLLDTQCKYKWGISGTPFVDLNSTSYILQYLVDEEIFFEPLGRFKRFYDMYLKIFRKNTKENIIKEIQFPNVNEFNLFLDLNSKEKMIYEAEIISNKHKEKKNIDHLRKCCCDMMLNFENFDQREISLNTFFSIIKDKYENELNEQKAILNKLIEDKNKLDDLIKRDESFANTEHYEQQIMEQKIILNNRLSSYNYVIEQIKKENECPICYEELNEENRYSILECGHMYCHDCMLIIKNLKNDYIKCSLCQKMFNKKKQIFTIGKNEVKIKSSTKLMKLNEILENNPNDKFVLYSNFDDMIKKISYYLNKSNLSNIIFNKYEDIENFKNSDTKVLILSSKRNASGLDLSFVNNMIIFEPLITMKTYLKDIEKQLIGRLHRKGQTNDVNVYRFIMNDTIESEIFKQ